LLIGGSPTKLFHLKEFGDALTKFGVNYKLVLDTDYCDGFPSRKLSHWFTNNAKFRNLLHTFSPDAVFIDRQRHFGLATLKEKLPLFILLRGDYWTELEWARKTLYKYPHKRLALLKWDKIAKENFEGSRMILPICKYLQNLVKTHYPNKETEVLYQGIEPSRWYAVSGMNLKHPCVGILQSAIIWGKTKEMLVLTKVLEAMPDVTFYWAGDGPYRDKILPILSKYDNFKWLGQLKYPDDVRKFLSEIDVYALVSGIDMSPLTLQEASLMEKPVVATKVGGIPELVKDGITGYLVPQGNPLELKERLADLLNDAKKAKQMGKEGRNFIKDNFSWEVIARKFVDILNRI